MHYEELPFAVRTEVLERRLLKEQNRRKMLRDEVRELRERVDVMMTFLDGKWLGKEQFHKVGLTEEGGEDDA